MDNNPQRQQTAERVKQASNVLVTVSNNPSVDQLAACIGLTLALNKMGKHATAVFSGAVPSTIEFLQPEKTIEKNTDSLRDFIISLDKSKADKLRYKVEDKVVKIFITPYRTSISDKDLQFSQGDFNVDVVITIGVHNQRELDQAVTAHGRILHDATVITMNVKPGGELGAINWLDPRASSLSELATQLIDAIDKKVVDSQIATALLTGIVAETKRFSNDKTSPLTMSYSAELMSAGANQQLVATKLEERPKPPPPPPPPPAAPTPAAPAGQQPALPQTPPKPNTEGVLEITHDDKPKPMALEDLEKEVEQPFAPQIDIDQEGLLRRVEAEKPSVGAPTNSVPKSEAKDKVDVDPTVHMASGRKILPPPPVEDTKLTANAFSENASGEGTVDPLSTPSTPLLHRSSGVSYEAAPAPDAQDAGQDGNKTLSDIEKAVGSPHVTQAAAASDGNATDLSNVRDAVAQAANNSSPETPPIAALNAQPLGQDLHNDADVNDAPQDSKGPMLPPPVPPPMMPPPSP